VIDHAFDNRAKVLLARKTNENHKLGVIMTTAPTKCKKSQKALKAAL